MIRTINRPIRKEERFVSLVMWHDLPEDAQDTVMRKYDHYDVCEWHMQNVYEDLQFSADWFERQTGQKVKLESVHGPGTEMYFPCELDCSEYWSMGPEKVPYIDGRSMGCYELDIADAWNSHVSTINSLAELAEEAEEWDEDRRERLWFELERRQDAYLDAINDATADVASTLNRLQNSEEEYTWTKEFFEYMVIDCDDSEHWFTEDGENEYTRDPSGVVNVCEPCNYIEEIADENGRLVILEEFTA